MATGTNGVIAGPTCYGGAAVNFNIVVSIACLHPIADARINGVVAAACNDDIGTFRVRQDVITCTANQGVTALCAAEVIMRSVIEVRVGDCLGVQWVAVEDNIAHPCCQTIITRPTRQVVGADTAVQGVFAIPSRQVVVARSARQGVRSCVTVKIVIATQTREQVVVRAAISTATTITHGHKIGASFSVKIGVAVESAGQGVIAGASINRRTAAQPGNHQVIAITRVNDTA